ncbi:hypothetical protein DIPPA_16066, partial [Diplonema papillatum]
WPFASMSWPEYRRSRPDAEPTTLGYLSFNFRTTMRAISSSFGSLKSGARALAPPALLGKEFDVLTSRANSGSSECCEELG